MSGEGTPVICQIQGQIMAHRHLIIAILKMLRTGEVLHPDVLKLLDQHLEKTAGMMLDVARQAAPDSPASQDAVHLAAGFDEEIQNILDAISTPKS